MTENVAGRVKSSPLRQRMIDQMRIANLAASTQSAYLFEVERMAKHYGASPADLDAEQVRDFVLTLIDRDLSPATTNSTLLASQLMPAFGSVPLDRISPVRVRRWFDAFSRTAPANANRGLEALRQIMNFAIACGYADNNPAVGIALNPRPKLTRFLSREEIDRLHRALDRQSGRDQRQQADIVRLLLLTGCRRGEIVQLRWSELRDDTLMLEESKTGPRSVPLNSQVRRILDRQPRNDSPFVFPSSYDPSRPAAPTSASGTVSERKPASRTCAFTISDTRMPATR